MLAGPFMLRALCNTAVVLVALAQGSGSSAAPLLPLSSGQSLNQEPAASQTPQQLAPANPLSAPPASTASGPASLPVAPAVSISTASPPASPPDPPAPVASTQLRVTNPAPAQAQVPSQGAAAFHGESPEDALLSVPDSQLDQSELALDSAALAPLAPGPVAGLALEAAIKTAANSLASNAATLDSLSSASTIANVQSIAGEMELGSLGYLIRLLAPASWVPVTTTSTTSTSTNFLSNFPRYSDVIQQLANFNNSLLSIPNNPWSSVNGPSAGNYWNLTPVQTYIWYHNTFAMETWSALTEYIADPTNQDGLTSLIQACQSGFVSDWLMYMTAASDPTGTCYNATEYGFQLEFNVCLFAVGNGVADEVNYQDSTYISYAAAFISDAAFTAEFASACNGVNQNGDLYPFSRAADFTAFNIPYYQANYTAIVQNYVTYAGYLPSLFWNGALLTNVNNSFSNSIGNSQDISSYQGGQNQYLADNLHFVFWDVIVFDANPSGADAIVATCLSPFPSLPNPSAALCASNGGSIYNPDFPLANSQFIGFALFFTNPGETPQVAALNDTLINVCEGCQSNSTNNNDPQLMVPCISANLSSTGTRGVMAVHFDNGLRAQIYGTMLFFVNLPISGPDTSFIILPAQSFG